MGERGSQEERLLKEMVSRFRCHVCRRAFEREQVRVAARQDQIWFVSVRCGYCRKQQLFCLALSDSALEEAGDLSAAEEERFAAMSPVSSDDVLDIHEFLVEFNGNFRTLFSRSSR